MREAVDQQLNSGEMSLEGQPIARRFGPEGGLLSIEDCRRYLGDEIATDAEIEAIRGALYAFVEKRLVDKPAQSGIVLMRDLGHKKD